MADAPPSSYRDYETEARTLVQRLLGASLERLERGAEQGWPRGDALTAQGGGAAIEEHIKVIISRGFPQTAMIMYSAVVCVCVCVELGGG